MVRRGSGFVRGDGVSCLQEEGGDEGDDGQTPEWSRGSHGWNLPIYAYVSSTAGVCLGLRFLVVAKRGLDCRKYKIGSEVFGRP